jgi:hypothetical protein
VLDQTPASYGIANGDAVIVMKSKAPAPPKPAQPESVPAPAPASAPVSQQPPVQQIHAPATTPAPAPEVDPIWTTPPQTDAVASYSVEQAHIILPMVFSYIMQNPNLRLLLLTNPNALNEIMITQNFRNIVRQLLVQSPTLLNAIRTGATANIHIGIEPTVAQGSAGTGQPQLTMEQLTQAMQMLGGMDGQWEDDYGDDYEDGHSHDHSGHDHSHDHSHSTPTSTGTGLTAQDQQNIAQLMEVTGAQFPVAKQAYESSGKNMEVAGALLMQIMFS